MVRIKSLTHIFCLSGIVAIIFYLLHDIIGAANYPGYNWMSQAVSDLTATDAPSFIVANGLSTVYGIFSCLCCAALCILVQKGLAQKIGSQQSVKSEEIKQGNKNANGKKNKSKSLKLGIYLFAIMNFVSAIGYSLFPLSSAGYDGSVQSFIHIYVVTILVVLLSIISLILIAIGAFKSKRKALGTLAIIAFVMMFVGAAGSASVPKEFFGVVERFSTYSAVVFTGILGIYGFCGKLEARKEK